MTINNAPNLRIVHFLHTIDVCSGIINNMKIVFKCVFFLFCISTAEAIVSILRTGQSKQWTVRAKPVLVVGLKLRTTHTYVYGPYRNPVGRAKGQSSGERPRDVAVSGVPACLRAALIWHSCFGYKYACVYASRWQVAPYHQYASKFNR